MNRYKIGIAFSTSLIHNFRPRVGPELLRGRSTDERGPLNPDLFILADDYQVKMLQAAHKYNRTEENMEVKMVAARIQNGYKPGGGIRANEIKGFLNIWCNQRRLKPEYDFIEAGFH